jgi:hypothetical protein
LTSFQASLRIISFFVCFSQDELERETSGDMPTITSSYILMLIYIIFALGIQLFLCKPSHVGLCYLCIQVSFARSPS